MKVLWMLAMVLCAAACAQPMIRGSVYTLDPVVQAFSSDTNAVYYGVRWALAERGYPVGYEDLPGGIISSAWVPTKSDSHYVQTFGSKDFGTTGAYHQLEVRVTPYGGYTQVTVTSRVKSLVNGVRSSRREEKKILREITNYLHGAGVEVTNIGVDA